MIEQLLQFFDKYPWLLIIMVVIILGGVFLISKRNDITTPWFKISPSNSKEHKSEPNQSVVVQNVITPSVSKFSDEELEDVGERMARYVLDIQAKTTTHEKPLFDPPKIPERIAYYYNVWNYIETLIRHIVLSWGGPWAGHSLADFSVYFDLAITQNLISDELKAKIQDFQLYAQPFINNNSITDKGFLDIQYLSSDICEQLNGILASRTSQGFEGSEWSGKYPEEE